MMIVMKAVLLTMMENYGIIDLQNCMEPQASDECYSSDQKHATTGSDSLLLVIVVVSSL
jgi:hypothetical protein